MFVISIAVIAIPLKSPMLHDLIENCPLCQGAAVAFYKNEFFKCGQCYGIFLSRKLLPDEKSEKARYEMHNNDIYDLRYQKFVSPITEAIFRDFTEQHSGLDFGAGTGSAILKLLSDKGYKIKQYDPFFFPASELLAEKYDYIACCEVMEHFHYPEKEFALLKRLLKPGGRLYCMTSIYSPEIDFDNWYYKNDPTHVFLYQKETLEWIKEKMGFAEVNINGKLVQFNNRKNGAGESVGENKPGPNP